MAKAHDNPRDPLDPPEDPRCRYTLFTQRHDGKISCLALGENVVGQVAVELGEITGVGFQKVDTGKVRPVVPNDMFTDIYWPNSPTQAQQAPFLELGDPPQAPPQMWVEFATTMYHAREAMLNLMKPGNGNQPQSLLAGLQSNVWIGGTKGRYDLTGNGIRTAAVLNAARAHLSNNRCIKEWVEAVINGLYSATGQFKNVFSLLFPNDKPFGQQGFVSGPTETSKNGTIRDGVMHSLMYGYHQEQMRGRRTTRAQPGVDDNTRLDKRVVLPKKSCLRARSRSRSPVSSDDEDNDDELHQHVVDTTRRLCAPTINDMLNNPDNYVLKSDIHYKYFKPHKPDLVIFTSSNVPSPVDPRCLKEVVMAKIMFELSSWKKFGADISIESHIILNTEKCVHSCLSGLSSNQDIMLGVVVVVDGLKLIQLEKKRQNDGAFRYCISETDLITWDKTNQLYALFDLINSKLQ